jgi:MFS transporter, FHS family, glucose/mannose:H+ symporter
VSQTPSKFEIGLLYGAGVVQGLALVTFPAASAIFVSPTGFGLSGTQYGSMFLPQVVLAIGASAFSPRLAHRFGLRGVLLLGLCGDLLSMGLLAASSLLIGSAQAFLLLCVATGALGFGFGATVMALNTLVEGIFPDRADGAVLALNALLGVGTALAPLLVTLFNGLGVWWALPIAMIVLLILLITGVSHAPLRLSYQATDRDGGLPPRFWVYAGAVLLYGVLETLCGNWATLYLSTQRHVSVRNASLALTAFWVMLTLGRVIVAFLERLIPGRWIYVALPILLAGAFQFIARSQDPVAGIGSFGAAGLACSALLPLSISFGGTEFPSKAAAMSGELIAFYQIGYGIAAFGVGPLRGGAGLAFSEIFSAGSLISLGLGLVTLLVIRVPVHARK